MPTSSKTSPPGPVKARVKACMADRERMERVHSALMVFTISASLAIPVTVVIMAVTMAILVFIKDAGFTVFYADVQREIARVEADIRGDS